MSPYTLTLSTNNDQQIFWRQDREFERSGQEQEREVEYFRDDNHSMFTGYTLLPNNANFETLSDLESTSLFDSSDHPLSDRDSGLLSLSDSASLARKNDNSGSGRFRLVNCQLQTGEREERTTISSDFTLSITIINNGPKPIPGPFLLKIKPNAFGLMAVEDRLSNKFTYVSPGHPLTISAQLGMDLSRLDLTICEDIPLVS